MSGNPFALSAEEIAQVESDAVGVIEADDTTAQIWRPVVAGADEFDGQHEASYALVGIFNIDFHLDPVSEVLFEGSDAEADMALDADVQKRDRAVIRGETYRVRHVRPYRAFGAKTHKRLTLTVETDDE